MSESQNFLLFKRNSQDSSHDDVWDDSALIQAYDRAVNLAKEKVAAKLGLEEEARASTSAEEPRNSIAEKQGSPSKSSKQLNWKVGDYVRAVYTQDGVVYEASIENINIDSSTCLVKYLGYNNEEEISLKDLLPSAGVAARRKQVSEAVDVYSSDDMECEVPYKSPSSAKSAPTPNLKWQPVEPDSSFPTPLHQTSHAPMSIPPPPPPAAWPSGSEMDSDSLYSMLMSWYMAGYHTGYHQASQQKNKRRHLGPS